MKIQLSLVLCTPHVRGTKIPFGISGIHSAEQVLEPNPRLSKTWNLLDHQEQRQERTHVLREKFSPPRHILDHHEQEPLTVVLRMRSLRKL